MDTKNKINICKGIFILACIFGVCFASKAQVQQEGMFDSSFPVPATITMKTGETFEQDLRYVQNAESQSSNQLRMNVSTPIRISIKIKDMSMTKGANNDLPIIIALGLRAPGREYQPLGIYGKGSSYSTDLYEEGTYTLAYGNFAVMQLSYEEMQASTKDARYVVMGSNVYKITLEIKCEAINKEEETSPYPSVIAPDASKPTKLVNTCDHNYVATFEGTEGRGDIGKLTVDYLDDFGKEEETVYSDYVCDGKNLVMYQEYDEWGRKGKSWSPISIPSQCKGGYTPLSYIQANITEGAYSYPVYEASLENRIVKNFGDGHVWHSKGKCDKLDYFTNKEDKDSLGCLMLEFSGDMSDYKIKAKGFWPKGTLFVIRAEDEDCHAKFIFKDMFGKLILTRQIESTKEGKNFYDTYYIYGKMDKLVAVIPPALSDGITTGESLDKESVERYAYCYAYDELERNIGKKLPGCAWIKMYYDKADRMVLSQDGEQRQRNKATFLCFDAFGRKCIVGTCNISQQQQNISDYVYCKYEGKKKEYCGYDIKGYTFHEPTILTVDYYDSYNFLKDGWMSSQLRGNYCRHDGYANITSVSQDFLTGTIRKVIGVENQPGINKVIYYDQMGRIAQRKIFNYEYENEEVSYAYDFTDNPTRLKRIYGTNNYSVEEYTYDYDRYGRPTIETLCINNGEKVTINNYEYDELGRILSKGHANNKSLGTSYSYNNRSWLTEIKGDLFSEKMRHQESNKLYSGKIAGLAWKEDGSSYRDHYDFGYDKLGRLTTACYNNRKYYNSVYYKYDKMGNVTSLTRSGDRDNNHYGTIDILTYTYNGNQVVKIEDEESGPYFKGAFHFINGADKDIEYAYDTNGNMTMDLNKGIQNIDYNVLNLPCAINFLKQNDQSGITENKKIEYYYDGEGKKLAVIYTDGDTATDENTFSYSYTENRTFENGELKQILFNGGYVSFEKEKPEYHFYIQDHLGNNRIVANAKGAVEQRNTYYPFGALIQGGFSEDISSNQRYKFNGKELDRMFGLDSYDYGARMYDPSMIRWRSIDPLCEKYYSISPYAYCNNDPINSFDKDGMYIYMLFYVAGYARIGYDGDDDFKAAAYTRKADIEKSKWFNKQRDIVIVSEIENFADLAQLVSKNINENKKYGKTIEVGIWSHSGYDGPIGSVNTDDEDIIGSRQLSLSGWEKINFNWAANASIGIYGCNSGKSDDDSGKNFAKSISKNANMKNVNVYGQPSSSAFSNAQYEAKNIDSSCQKLHDKDYYFPQTYQIATKFYTKFWWLNSEIIRMKLYKNGKELR